jgi:hypothetical protein
LRTEHLSVVRNQAVQGRHNTRWGVNEICRHLR